jgi:hypothetical protein
LGIVQDCACSGQLSIALFSRAVPNGSCVSYHNLIVRGNKGTAAGGISNKEQGILNDEGREGLFFIIQFQFRNVKLILSTIKLRRMKK